ncbi:hypothetical protein PDESU_03965 [Pontiella desulfatans]|uniref:PEP-CTERM protein-sorting domain-containing protein n=1 Tax=Pontiella desulfatans TaxID=2750659 RepID=A0A6C2U5N4_PONDE|nr:PEP-CTERM sorting domain-containing protein [Pontiella desulfatans]VGO15382.1 hypothetical protein PDESU_03965 [Pontiella desulfatans]
MEKTVLLAVFAMCAGLAQAEIIALDSTSSQIVTDGTTTGNSIGVTAGSRVFAIGETAIVTAQLTMTGTPAYNASANWTLGFRDNVNEVGSALSIRLNSVPLWNASTDSSAASAGGNTADLGTTERESTTNVDGTTADMKTDGDVSLLEMRVTKVSATQYGYVAYWKDGSGNTLESLSKTYDLGKEIASITDVTFGNRATTTTVTGALTNIQLEVIPEPATLGLITALGTGLLVVRRFFVI